MQETRIAYSRIPLFSVLILLLSFATPALAAPRIFYTDITSGPSTGGEGNNGAYLSIFGKNFGTSLANVKVYVGGGEVARYLYLGASRGRSDIQQLSVQLGPTVATGAVQVSVGGVASNTDQTFTVRPGNIYFVSPSGNNANSGTFSSPWATIDVAKSRLLQGDFLYAMDGTSQTVNDTVAGSGDGALRITTSNNSARAGTATQPITIAAYPNATVTIGSPTLGNGIRTYLPYWTFSGLTLVGGNQQYSLAFDVSDYLVSGTGTVAGLRIVNNDLTSGYYGLEFDSVSNSKVIGNKIHDTPHTAIYYGGTGVPASNIEYGWNQIYNVGPNAQGMGSYGIKLYYAWTSGPAPANRYLSGVSIHDNIIHHIVGSGVLAGGADWGGYPWLKDVTVYNNVIYNAGRDTEEGGFSVGRVGLGETLMDLVLYNNTIYNCPVPVEYEAVHTAVSRNNIFYPSGTGTGPYVTGSLTTGTFTIDHNLYFNGTGVPSQDTAPILGDPVFVDTTVYNLHLQVTSKAIDAGASAVVGLVTMDIDGNPRPQGLGFDVGALESTGATLPSPQNVQLRKQ